MENAESPVVVAADAGTEWMVVYTTLAVLVETITSGGPTPATVLG
jgi:hypothetical protein